MPLTPVKIRSTRRGWPGAGATFSTNGSALTNAAGASIEGSGTIDTGAALLVNDGAVRPGGANAIGTLTISGALQQGAGGRVEMALAQLTEREVGHLDEERRAPLVGNLLVVLCGNSQATPVLNAGSHYT